jgi:hypothetical protein
VIAFRRASLVPDSPTGLSKVDIARVKEKILVKQWPVLQCVQSTSFS